MIDEAQERLTCFRKKKLHDPLPWNDRKWTDTCDALAKLAERVPEISDEIASSPVADY